MQHLVDDQHDMLDLLFVYGAVPSTQSFHYVIAEEDTETIQILLQDGTDPNAVLSTYTALLRAIDDCNEPVISSLLDHSASVLNKGSPEWTPLNYVRHKGT